MNPLKFLANLASATVLPLALFLASPTTQAFSGTGTVTLSGGSSTLNFSPQFFNLFSALGASLDRYGKATFKGSLNKQDLRIRFPLAAGTLNPSRPFISKDPFYDLQHQGGLLMTRESPFLSVVFNTPTLRTGISCWASTRCLELGATLIVNGNVFDYVPNFAQNTALPTSFPISSGNQVNIDKIEFFLTARGAELMNAFFGLKSSDDIFLTTGFPFGTLDIKATGAKIICPPGTSYIKKYQQCI